jgi:SRSO17 transposase
MKTDVSLEQQKRLVADEELNLISQGAHMLEELCARIGRHARRAEVRQRLRGYIYGLLAPVQRKNGWQMAEKVGDPNAHGVQRLLAEADWDEEAMCEELRTYVIEHVGETGGILVIDETNFLKKGKKSAGVARQYSRTAGRRENSQVGIFLLYASSRGAAFVDRALYLPQEWTNDRMRCREAGIPDEVEFATKGELAQRMLARAFAAEVPARWVVGDTVSGYEELRSWLDDHQQNSVLAVPETHMVLVHGQRQPVEMLAGLLPAASWVVLSAGEGKTGPRLYEWTWLQLPQDVECRQERAHFLLIRRSLIDPAKRVYYRVSAPVQTTLREIVQVAGSRWKIEACYEQARGEVGLDDYEVRTWRAWYRYITLALLAYAALVVIQGQARLLEKKPDTLRSAEN